MARATPTSRSLKRAVTMTSRSHSPDLVDSRNEQISMNWEQGSGCVTLNGQGGSTRGGLTTTATLTGVQRCENQCPSAGKVTVESKNGVFSTEFNGTSSVNVTDPDGETKRYELNCP